MSFMTSFFTLNITEFRRDDDGTLGLGYVSEILSEAKPHSLKYLQ